MDVIIKKMETDGEIRGKAYVHWRAWHEAYSGIVSGEYLGRFTLEKCEKIAFDQPDGVDVAKDGGRVVGFVGCGAREGGEGEIYSLYVLPEYFGKGVGSALMGAALERLKGCPRVCLRVLKENERAVRFYRKSGFLPDGTEAFDPVLRAAVIGMAFTRGPGAGRSNGTAGDGTGAEEGGPVAFHSTTEEEMRVFRGFRYGGEYAVYNVSPHEEQAAARDPRNGCYTCTIGGRTAGYIRLAERESEVSFGIALDPDMCGRGYGPRICEKARELSHRLYPGKPVCLVVRTWNARAVRCYEKAGFRIAGRPFWMAPPSGEGLFYRMEERDAPPAARRDPGLQV